MQNQAIIKEIRRLRPAICGEPGNQFFGTRYLRFYNDNDCLRYGLELAPIGATVKQIAEAGLRDAASRDEYNYDSERNGGRE